MSENSKTAEDIAGLLTQFATGLDQHVAKHPTLRGLIGQINKKAQSMTRPVKEGKPVCLSYVDGQIVIENTPYLHRSAFGAWRFRLAECKGEVTGSRVNEETGEELPTYASTYDKEMQKSVMPENKKEELLAVIKSFFPDSPIEEV